MPYFYAWTSNTFHDSLMDFQKGYSFIVGSVHIANIPACAVNIINFAMSKLKEKFKARVRNAQSVRGSEKQLVSWFQIYVHEKGKDVLKYFPKDVIPVDYGGEEKSLEELNGAYCPLLQG